MRLLLGFVFVQMVASWSTTNQANMASPSAVSVSPDGLWAVYLVSKVIGTSIGSFSPTSALALVPLGSGSTAAGAPVIDFCSDACTDPTFSPDGSLAVLKQGAVYRSVLKDSAWTIPWAVEVPGPVLAYSVSPNSQVIAYTVLDTPITAGSEALEVSMDMPLIDVITGTAMNRRNLLCVAPFGEAAHAEPRCFHQINGSVGFEGWRISCWPYDSQFSWGAESSLAITWTRSLFANDWETTRVFTLNTTSPDPELVPIGGPVSFQPLFSPTGKVLAFTQADSSEYTWAQTWKICLWSAGVVRCAEPTLDAMPTLVGWSSTGVLYLEQNRTEVGLFEMKVSSSGQPSSWGPVRGTPCVAGDCGVVGGGFRATSRAVISGSSIGFSWEGLHTPPQAYVATLSGGALTQVRQISELNPGVSAVQWPNVSVHRWSSDDGTAVEGLLIHAARPQSTPAPLIVFTHCGPAMASLSTFVGFGSVCARFPLEILAMQGYNVLLPNYRGSTGYGRAFRRADLNGWGDGDYQDVMSGLQSVPSSGVAHVGWSYGGYMSALALVKAETTHGIKLAAVVGGGCLADLISQSGTTDITKIYESSNSGKYYWDDPQVQQNFMARSAMYHVANASAPTLLFHGAHDPRMPMSQVFQLNYALKARGVESKLLAFPGSGHIPGDPNQLVRMWDETIVWINQHLHG